MARRIFDNQKTSIPKATFGPWQVYWSKVLRKKRNSAETVIKRVEKVLVETSMHTSERIAEFRFTIDYQETNLIVRLGDREETL